MGAYEGFLIAHSLDYVSQFMKMRTVPLVWSIDFGKREEETETHGSNKFHFVSNVSANTPRSSAKTRDSTKSEIQLAVLCCVLLFDFGRNR